MPSLFMILVGCRPEGRHTEQHDVFFGIANSITELLPEIKAFWPEGKHNLHIDAYREVKKVGNYLISIQPEAAPKEQSLYFINLGGYKQNEFEEFHYRMLIAAPDELTAKRTSRDSAFYKHTGFRKAPAHIDDKFGVDVDDLSKVDEILSAASKARGHIHFVPAKEGHPEDEMRLGYFKLKSFEQAAHPEPS